MSTRQHSTMARAAACPAHPMMAVEWKQGFLPVTALSFCSVAGTQLLLAGEGPFLKVFSRSGQLLACEELLPCHRVHGLRTALESCHGDGSILVAVFGQRALCVASLSLECGRARVSLRVGVAELCDWLLDVCWLSPGATVGPALAAVTAHNAVVLCVGRDLQEHTCLRSEVSCILYSARLRCDGAGCISVASGTVFGRILLWHCHTGETPTPRAKVNLTLRGHEGVIFSLRFSEDERSLLSASDDRSIRLWPLPCDWKTLDGAACGVGVVVMYGHTARVWDAQFLPTGLVSVGEDARCRVWGLDGRSTAVMEGHRGRNIWSMALDKEASVVATGGGDCGIRLFSLQLLSAPLGASWEWHLPRPAAGRMAPRPASTRLVLLRGETAVCLSSDGCVYCLEAATRRESGGAGPLPYPGLGDVTGTLLHSDPALEGYSIMALSPCQRLLALGTLAGWLKLLVLRAGGGCSAKAALRAHSGKVFALLWSQDHAPQTQGHAPQSLLLSCGPEGSMACWRVGVVSGNPVISALALLRLPASRHRWPSAVVVLPGGGASRADSEEWRAVCGDRRGSLHLYRADHTPLPLCDSTHIDPTHSLTGLHGPNGVTCLQLHTHCVFSAGRDGFCRQFSLGADGRLMQLTKFKPVQGMDWIERLMFTDDDLLVFGFLATAMVLHSRQQNRRLLRLECGGGHRSYGFSSLTELLRTKRAAAVFVKQSQVCYRQVSIEHYLSSPVVQEGFLGREATALLLLHADTASGEGLVAVGSEDCSVCLLAVGAGGQSSAPSMAPRCLRSLRGHTSSVRALSSCACWWDESHALLFSGGGRACIKAWRVPVGGVASDAVGGVADDAPASLEAELHLFSGDPEQRRRWRGGKPRNRPDDDAGLPECRVMALVSFPVPISLYCGMDPGLHYVAAGCSDGLVRQYVYSERKRSFSVLPLIKFHERCLLVMEHVVHSQPGGGAMGQPHPPALSLLLLSAATDGRLAVWSLAPSLSGWLQGSHPDLVEPLAPVCVLPLHQSGINCMALLPRGADGYLVATGGDDSTVVASLLSCSPPPPPPHCKPPPPPHCTPPVWTMRKLCSRPSAHSSSITGVCFTSSGRLVSTAVDQRLVVWGLQACEADGAHSLEAVSVFSHDVADASGLVVYPSSVGPVAVVCGVGLQCFAWREDIR